MFTVRREIHIICFVSSISVIHYENRASLQIRWDQWRE